MSATDAPTIEVLPTGVRVTVGRVVDFARLCARCSRADLPLGVVHRPGKAVGVWCRGCWRKKGHSLRNGHGYAWTPLP